MPGRLIDADASPWLWVETTWAVILCALALVVRLVVRGHECGLEDLLLILSFVSEKSLVEFVSRLTFDLDPRHGVVRMYLSGASRWTRYLTSQLGRRANPSNCFSKEKPVHGDCSS